VPPCTLGGRPPGSCKAADCHSFEELGFQLLDKGDLMILPASVVGYTGPLNTLRMLAFWHHPLSSRLQLSSHSGEYGVLAFQ
jgi:hypothetical protein